MALAYALGTALVERSELVSRRRAGDFAALDGRGFAPKLMKLEMSTGVFSAPRTEAELPPPKDDTGNPVPFEPIGLNKPLTIAIREVYTGRFPKWPAFDRSLLIASAVKGTALYSEAPRAVNAIKQNVSRQMRQRVFAAPEKGTPYIYHTPALTQVATSVTVELNFAGFPQELTDEIGGALEAASAVPAFAPASPYLLIAGVVTKLAGNLAHALADSGSAEMTYSEDINFVDPGSPISHARFVLAIDERDPEYARVLQEYMINDSGMLVRVQNQSEKYTGDAPYVIYSLNGLKRDDLKDFAPTAATAAQLAKYFNLGEERQTLAGLSIESAKAYNDLTLIPRVRDVQDKLTAAQSDDLKKQLQEQLNGLMASIYSDELKKLLKPA